MNEKSEYKVELYNKFSENEKYLYYISSYGRVIKIKRENYNTCIVNSVCEEMTPNTDYYDNLIVNVGTTNYLIKNLVMKYFTRDWYPHAVVVHIDGNKKNNRLDNLKITNKYKKNKGLCKIAS